MTEQPDELSRLAVNSVLAKLARRYPHGRLAITLREGAEIDYYEVTQPDGTVLRFDAVGERV